MKIKEQFRRNAVALISLAIALTSLGYNTWRNEVSERNRTQRTVAVEVLMQLGELQQITWHHHYDKDFENKGNLRTGWTKVTVIRDISQILDDPMPESTQELHAIWNENSEDLDTSVAAKDAVINGIAQVRADALLVLRELD